MGLNLIERFLLDSKNEIFEKLKEHQHNLVRLHDLDSFLVKFSYASYESYTLKNNIDPVVLFTFNLLDKKWFTVIFSKYRHTSDDDWHLEISDDYSYDLLNENYVNLSLGVEELKKDLFDINSVKSLVNQYNKNLKELYILNLVRTSQKITEKLATEFTKHTVEFYNNGVQDVISISVNDEVLLLKESNGNVSVFEENIKLKDLLDLHIELDYFLSENALRFFLE